MMYKFVDREEELQAWERLYNAKGSALAVIYGRRRIGKAELIKNFIRGKPASAEVADQYAYCMLLTLFLLYDLIQDPFISI